MFKTAVLETVSITPTTSHLTMELVTTVFKTVSINLTTNHLIMELVTAVLETVSPSSGAHAEYL